MRIAGTIIIAVFSIGACSAIYQLFTSIGEAGWGVVLVGLGLIATGVGIFGVWHSPLDNQPPHR